MIVILFKTVKIFTFASPLPFSRPAFWFGCFVHTFFFFFYCKMNVMFLLNINLVQKLFPYIKLLFCKYVQISRSFIVSFYLQSPFWICVWMCIWVFFVCKHWGGYGVVFKVIKIFKNNRLNCCISHEGIPLQKMPLLLMICHIELQILIYFATLSNHVT